ncbi:hypothetical protein NHX12_018088 [Muraenolepis orangiensis]|uniref:Uncharacterized protein n=1 Tax=Muraenolepis orangiensis TaxID=630683 RepID=A0A9Q0IYL2_9TELE|nr:hypothetical protein NHX12_018088 [Muraenolepis orangiensis]
MRNPQPAPRLAWTSPPLPPLERGPAGQPRKPGDVFLRSRGRPGPGAYSDRGEGLDWGLMFYSGQRGRLWSGGRKLHGWAGGDDGPHKHPGWAPSQAAGGRGEEYGDGASRASSGPLAQETPGPKGSPNRTPTENPPAPAWG